MGSGYPTGPPTCGSSGDPTCKVWITAMSQGGPAAVFSFWILVFVAVSSFQLYRAMHVARHPSSSCILRGHGSGKNGLKSASGGAQSEQEAQIAGAAEAVIEVEAEPVLRLTGYREVLAGGLCWWLLILTSLHWVCIYLLVLVDTYYGCQMTGIDNLCFYGKYFVFGTYERNGSVLFTIWCISVVWFTALVVFKREVHNWFRMPCSLQSADVVHVWAQDQEEILSVNVSRLVHFVRKLKNKCSVSRRDRKGHTETVPVTRTELGSRYVLFQGHRYLIAKDGSLHLARVEVAHTCADFHKLAGGLSSSEAQARYDTVGPNEVPFKAETLWESVVEECFTFFKVYQLLIYSMWLWFSYLVVGSLLLAVVVLAASITIFNRRRAQFAIAKLTEYESVVEVKRDGEWRKVDFRLLVPGDVVRVQSDWSLPCDLVILQGVCVCNESNLTGEAMPVQKHKAPDNNGEVYDAEAAKGARHTLFSGTQVLQAGTRGMSSSSEVVAVVTSTGMSTSKGKLLSTILFPQLMLFKYDEELPIVVGLLLCYALVCFALSLTFQYRTKQQSIWITKWAYCVAIVSQIVSPLLPVALEIGQIYASGRLKNRGIFCRNAKRIAIAGKIRVICFDKTGTLTNNGLEFIGIQGTHATNAQFRPTQSPWNHDLLDAVILRGLAACHAVTKYGAQFVGNEVEVKMFSSAGWDLAEGGAAVSNKTGDVLTIVRRNEFEHTRATMSVSLCKTALGSFMTAARSLGKDMSLETVMTLSRDEVEADLTFISLLLFRNELKEDTRSAIETLRGGEVRSLMVTGDNAQCGFFIAKECAMVAGHVEVLLAELNREGRLMWQPMAPGSNGQPLSTTAMWKMHQRGLEGGLTELAVTGKAFNELCRIGRMQELLLFTRIFARFTPEDKVKVVNMHRDLGLVVGMCGDGGNDCGALRSAHVGLALSDAEASVVSPFTSKSKSVSSAAELVREGRAALHTSFACYKFLIIYGLSFSLFKLSANWYGVIGCQMDYIFIDGVAVLALGYTMNLGNPVKTLGKERPTSSLLGGQTLASVLGTWSINILFLVGALSYMSAQSGYTKWPATLSLGQYWWTLGDNWESTIIFFIIYFQFIASSLIFSFGSSFRRAFYRNYLLMISWVSIFIVVSLVLLLPPSRFTHLWHVSSEEFNRPNSTSPIWAAYQALGGAPSPAMSFSFRLHLWLLIVANIAVVALWHKVVDGPLARVAYQKFKPASAKFHL